MLKNIWRKSHFLLALIAGVFILLATISGLLLSLEPGYNKIYNTSNVSIDDVLVSEFITILKKNHKEIIEITVTQNHIKMATMEGDFYVNPISGKKTIKVFKQPTFFKYVTSFHRSLFFKKTGRILVSLSAFFLTLIALTGFFLLIRKLGFKGIWLRLKKESFYNYYHTYIGRLSFVFIIIISISGVYLSMVGFSFFETKKNNVVYADTLKSYEKTTIKNFKAFENVQMSDIKKIEFPFSKDAEDFFLMYLEDKEVQIHQYSGEIVKTSFYPFSQIMNVLSFKLHTGANSVLWSLVLLVSSISILFFMYSGFLISFKRLKKGSKNKAKANEAQIVILYGTENGSTKLFANQFFNFINKKHKLVFIDEMNSLKSYPKITDLIILTSTYGEGEAPVKAVKFLQKLEEINFSNGVNFSVVGFGSIEYAQYCKYAKDVRKVLLNKASFNEAIAPVYINKNNYNDFKVWASHWGNYKNITIDLPKERETFAPKEYTFKVIDKTSIDDGYGVTFYLELKSSIGKHLFSGDLIAVKPSKNEEARYYSIGKNKKGNVLIAVKKHSHGVCSNFLYQKNIGDVFKASEKENPNFHFPTKAKKIMMIANGTGIAPFMGMLFHKQKNVSIDIYWGVRTKEYTNHFEPLLKQKLATKIISSLQVVYSRENEDGFNYVQEIIEAKESTIIQLLNDGGIIMICGSLTMYASVYSLIDRILKDKYDKNLEYFKGNGQIVSDCY